MRKPAKMVHTPPLDLGGDAAASAPARAAAVVPPLRHAARWRGAELFFWLLPLAAYAVFPDDLVLLTQISITALFALSLDLLVGYAGVVSLGHAAFFGVGAYAAGLLAAHGMGDPMLGLLAAGLAAGLLGFVSSFFVMRGNDLTRLMVTLGVCMMLFEAANKFTSITGGVDGLQGIQMLPLLGAFRFDLAGKTGYLYSLAVLFILFLLARRMVYSPFGVSLGGIRQNALRMPALGVPVKSRLMALYTVAAVYAGIAGGLLAQTTQYVTIDVLSFERSADLMLIVILGGAGSLYGAMVGAVVFMVMQHVLSGMNPEYWQFYLGALLLAIVLFARNGIMGGLRSLQAWGGRR
jgi:branched-chain amino acid transport system permease protein